MDLIGEWDMRPHRSALDDASDRWLAAETEDFPRCCKAENFQRRVEGNMNPPNGLWSSAELPT